MLAAKEGGSQGNLLVLAEGKILAASGGAQEVNKCLAPTVLTVFRSAKTPILTFAGRVYKPYSGRWYPIHHVYSRSTHTLDLRAQYPYCNPHPFGRRTLHYHHRLKPCLHPHPRRQRYTHNAQDLDLPSPTRLSQKLRYDDRTARSPRHRAEGRIIPSQRCPRHEPEAQQRRNRSDDHRVALGDPEVRPDTHHQYPSYIFTKVNL